MEEVVGSSPIGSTKKSGTPHGGGCPLCGIGFKKGENGVCAGIDGFYFLTILSAGLGRDWANRRISGFWSSCCFPPGKTERLSLTRAI